MYWCGFLNFYTIVFAFRCIHIIHSWLHFDHILTTIWLHFDHILLQFDHILTTFQQHFGYTLKTCLFAHLPAQIQNCKSGSTKEVFATLTLYGNGLFWMCSVPKRSCHWELKWGLEEHRYLLREVKKAKQAKSWIKYPIYKLLCANGLWIVIAPFGGRGPAKKGQKRRVRYSRVCARNFEGRLEPKVECNTSVVLFISVWKKNYQESST